MQALLLGKKHGVFLQQMGIKHKCFWKSYIILAEENKIQVQNGNDKPIYHLFVKAIVKEVN